MATDLQLRGKRSHHWRRKLRRRNHLRSCQRKRRPRSYRLQHQKRALREVLVFLPSNLQSRVLLLYLLFCAQGRVDLERVAESAQCLGERFVRGGNEHLKPSPSRSLRRNDLVAIPNADFSSANKKHKFTEEILFCSST